MKFLPFDIDYHIAIHNQATKAAKTRADFSFLSALNPESVNALVLATELLQKSSQLSVRLPMGDGSTFIDNVNAQMQESDYKGVRSSLNKLNEFIVDDNLQSWYSEQLRRLSNPDLWEQICENPKAKRNHKQLRALKDQWLSTQAHYSAHNVTALWFVANNITDLFENYYRFANLEFNLHRYRLPKNIRVAYQEYLTVAAKNLLEFKNAICQSMLIRLQLATASGDITYNDHIYYTANWLQGNDLIKQRHGLPQTQRRDLTPVYFLQFVRYIKQCGTPHQQSSLKALSIFLSDDQYAAWENNETIVLAPKNIAERNLVPTSAPWFPRLFQNRYFRYCFIAENLWLFSSLRALENFSIINHGTTQAINHVRTIEEQLLRANQQVLEKKNISGINRFFQYKTILFTHEWSQYMIEAETSILIKKIAIVTIIHKNLAKNNAVLFEDTQVKKLLEEISESFTHVHLPQQHCERFYLIKAALLENNSTKIAPPSPTTTQAPASTNPFDPPVAKEPSKVTDIDISIFQLLNNIRLMDLDTTNFQEMLCTVKTAMKATANNKQPRSYQLMHGAIDTIFIQYLKKCASFNTQADFEKCQDKFLEIEQLLIAYSAEHIKTRIQTITEIRQQPNYWFLFQLKCRSYLASCQQKITPYLIANSVVLNNNPSKHDEPTVSQHILTQ